MKSISHLIYALYFLVILLFVSSCASSNKITYFDNVQDTSFISKLDATDIIIQSNDILSISISSLNPQASAIFNTGNNFGGASTSEATSLSAGYLVNSDGYIQLPILGNIKATGLTKKQLKDFITNSILEKKLLLDPIVNIRNLNFKVTVLGEVFKPTVVTAPSEKISLLEALGLAGDLTIYGKRENVLLIREINGRKQVRRIDLTSKNFFLSPYYYLQPNDVLYVEPNKAKMANASLARTLLPSIISAVSVIALVIYRFNR
ncbi:MAG: polysaccharide biosynthesis/export family protein [Ginsengibacter sp.]